MSEPGAGFTINCRFLEKRMGGISRYATGILSEVRRRDLPVRLVAPPYLHPSYEPLVRDADVERAGRFRGHLWEQLDLPGWLRRANGPALLNVVNTAPLMYRRQATVIHDLSYLRMPEAFSAGFRWFYRFMIPRAASISARIVTDSEFSKRELVELLGVKPDRVEVVYPFVGSGMLGLASRGQKPSGSGDYVLMVSSLNPRKNLRRALAAFHAAGVPGLRLVLVGASNKIFSAPGIGDLMAPNVEIRSRVSDEELVDLYRGARLFLYPSLYEGFGIPPLEAMVCDCPVVVSRVASLPEVCRSAAHYVDPLETGSIAEGIRTVAENESLRSSLIQRGRDVAARYGVEETVTRLVDIMRRVAVDE